jgi:hypothetical protein
MTKEQLENEAYEFLNEEERGRAVEFRDFLIEVYNRALEDAVRKSVTLTPDSVDELLNFRIDG